MPTPDDQRPFIQEIERHLGRTLSDRETELALSLRNDKTAALVARELDAAPVTDPKKIHPEHKDTAAE